MPNNRIYKNDHILDEDGVSRLKGHENFGYSDGRKSEIYLDGVMDSAADLSSRSSELEEHIKDWVSEYHLSRKRAQLLSGFDFDRSMSVLEVGCGCGAITRFLGENFDKVVSIEGNIHRAKLARKRTADLENVSILCAPFQEIEFAQKFDLVVCVGVYEYSGSFVDGDNPYDRVLSYFSEILTENGEIIVAIENQFGLKYFASAREDHIGVMFEGVTGYTSNPKGVRTFGKNEIQQRIEEYFPHVKFYYPYPDYKLPDIVISEDFLASGKAAELIAQSNSRDYHGEKPALFNERSATLELSKNKMLSFFANSFLIVASKQNVSRIGFPQQAIFHSSGRSSNFSTTTKILNEEPDTIVEKHLSYNEAPMNGTPVKLIPSKSKWVDSLSLQSQLYANCLNKTLDLKQGFAPVRNWLAYIHEMSVPGPSGPELSGKYLDCIWPNAYCVGGKIEMIDQEFVWHENIPVNVMFLRAAYNFVSKFDQEFPDKGAVNKSRAGRSLINEIASSLELDIRNSDYRIFIEIESTLQNVVYGIPKSNSSAYIRWYLFDRASLRKFRDLRSFVRKAKQYSFAKLGIS